MVSSFKFMSSLLTCLLLAGGFMAQKKNNKITRIHVEKLPYSLHAGIGVSNDNFYLFYEDKGASMWITDTSDIKTVTNALKHSRPLKNDAVDFSAKLYIEYESSVVDTLYLGTTRQFDLNNKRRRFLNNDVIFLVWPEMRQFYEKK